MAFNLFDMFPPNTQKSAPAVCLIQAITLELVDQFRFVKDGNAGFIRPMQRRFTLGY